MSTQHNCKACQATFTVTDQDLAFYTQLKLSTPQLCPLCRRQRRMAVRNERTIYQRTCDKCAKPFISIYSTDKTLTVYCPSCWWSDDWDPFQYGQAYDSNRSFFEQFAELRQRVPVIGLLAVGNDNSDFTNRSWYCKNCYLAFDTNTAENLLYTNTCYYNKDLVDCSGTDNSELSYQLLNCKKCFQVKYSIYAQDCYDSAFLYDCRNARNCFMSTNLRGEEYYFKNKKYSPEDYQQLISQYDLGSYAGVQKAYAEFLDFIQQAPRWSMILRSEKSSGENLMNCNNSQFCYGCSQLENCSYCVDSTGMKECYDCDYCGTGNANLCYEGMGFHDNYMCRISDSNGETQFCDYCVSCFNSKNLFGCISMRKGDYCILNKQYSEAEYNELTASIITQMQAANEWGEFFPITISPFAYNETVAQDFFPLAKDQALAKGYAWKDDDTKQYQSQSYVLPDHISEVPEDIINQLLACIDCGKNYKIIPQEISFYKSQLLAIPRQCPSCRLKQRMALRNPRQLWQRQCSCTNTEHSHSTPCNANVQTTYSPERTESVWCDSCYTKDSY